MIRYYISIVYYSYWKSVSNKDIITITPPYLDAFGAGIVATISVPIVQPTYGIFNVTFLYYTIVYILSEVQNQFIKLKDDRHIPACQCILTMYYLAHKSYIISLIICPLMPFYTFCFLYLLLYTCMFLHFVEVEQQIIGASFRGSSNISPNPI
jgi:hypothetical protein